MSRTPEVIINKTAVKWRNILIGCGIFAWLIAWGSFVGDDLTGQGIVFVLIGGALFFVASKVKTHYPKKGEVGVYQ